MSGWFELKPAVGGQFMFNLKAGNGKVILTSELYKAKQSAKKGITSVKNNSPNDGRYDRQTASNGEKYFELKAGSGESVGISELYTGPSGMEKGIAAVKKAAPGGTIKDRT
ncbi:MAG TPA: YegP family protein [Gemmatimonadales bacterium]|nr:YegP family protein [Gemmatimonadales bacterium]